MSDFGAKLREARERRGVSLREIAEHTKISMAALESLERNDPSRLPGGIFARALVRSYSAEVGLDPDVTLREFLARFDVEPPVTAGALAVTPSAARQFGARHRLAGLFVKIIVASLVAVAIILYLTRARGADEDSTVHGRDSARRSSHQTGPRPGLQIPPGI